MSMTHRYASIRTGAKALARLAPVVRLGAGIVGLGSFLSQARPLLSDAQFTRSERWIAASIALGTVVGFGLAGWVLGTLLKVASGLLVVLADQAEASWRAVDLLELHVIPALGRIVAGLDAAPAPASSPTAAPNPDAVRSLTRELAEAWAEDDVDRALDLRDELTRSLRGEDLRRLDRDLARWTRGLIEARLKARAVDWEVARWAARAVDGLGDEPDAIAIRNALPEIRRRAGLCRSCGRAVAGGRELCGRCAPNSPRGETK